MWTDRIDLLLNTKVCNRSNTPRCRVYCIYNCGCFFFICVSFDRRCCFRRYCILGVGFIAPPKIPIQVTWHLLSLSLNRRYIVFPRGRSQNWRYAQIKVEINIKNGTRFIPLWHSWMLGGKI